jgi:O-phosphoseryl-tRNA(Cys) synthetase
LEKRSRTESEIELFARLESNDTLAVDVFDRGTFISRAPRPNRGFGMRIVEAIAKAVTVDVDNGTHVRMIFTLPHHNDRIVS